MGNTHPHAQSAKPNRKCENTASLTAHDKPVTDTTDASTSGEVSDLPGTTTSSLIVGGPDRDTAALVLERQIHGLIGCSEERRIALDDLPDVYRKRYSNEFPHGKLGQAELNDVMHLFPSLAVLSFPWGTAYCIRRSDMAMFEREIKEQLDLANQFKIASLSQPMAGVSDSEACLEEQPTKHPESSSVSPSLPPPPHQCVAVSGSTDHVEQLILELIDKSSGNNLLLSTLPDQYFSVYKSTIPFKKHGHTKLKPFLESLPRLFVGGSFGACYVTRKKAEGFVQTEMGQSVLAKEELNSCDLPSMQGTATQDDSSRQSVSITTNSVPPPTDKDLADKLQLESESGDVLMAEDQKVTPLVMKEAALNLGSGLHRKLLSVLAQHPEGITTSQALKNVKGLPRYLRACASEAGLGFISPKPFLSHCEGISSKDVDGRRLFFLDDKVPPGEPPGHGGHSTTDSAAAIELVQLIEKNYRNRPFPGTKKQLKSFLASVDLLYSPAIRLWLEKGLEEGLSDKKRSKEVIKRVLHQLKRMGCISGTSKSLVWDLKIVQSIVEMGAVAAPAEGQLKERKSEVSGDIPVTFIDSAEALDLVVMKFPFNPLAKPQPYEDFVVAVDCEGVPESLFLIQVGTCNATYVFDCVKLGGKKVCESLRPLLTGPHVTKLFHDLHNDAVAISMVGGVFPLSYTLDTQLAIEALTGNLHIGFNNMLQQLGQDRHPLKNNLKNKMDDGHIFAQRPLPPDVLEYAALDVSLLVKAKESLFAVLGPSRPSIERASDRRAKMAPASGGARQMCFDVANAYSISSLELLQEVRPKDMLETTPLEVSDDTGVLLEMLPDDLRENLIEQTQQLSDIVLDKGREPLAWINGSRVHLGRENRTVSKDDIDGIVERLGGFGGDNRAGLERQLHRVSAMRNRQQEIIGLTLRVGRHVSGNATIVSDLMFADCYQSILFLGEPGSGKTTVVREVTKQLAERFNVCVVDTSNEIAGDGDIPHPCIGYARRMMVPSLDKQSSVMIECVQNHTPEVMVIDEIGRPTEVEAARTCKQRGVRLIASAHGDLRKLIKNPKLRGLVGGVETVTLGDAQAKEEAKKFGNAQVGPQKLKAQRAGPPTFDIIVELRRGAQHEWRIVMDVGEAVDQVLEGQKYKAQRRTRDPKTGALSLELEMA